MYLNSFAGSNRDIHTLWLICEVDIHLRHKRHTVVPSVIVGGYDLKPCVIGPVTHTLSNDVRACALEMSQRPIKGLVVRVPPHSASRH